MGSLALVAVAGPVPTVVAILPGIRRVFPGLSALPGWFLRPVSPSPSLSLASPAPELERPRGVDVAIGTMRNWGFEASFGPRIRLVSMTVVRSGSSSDPGADAGPDVMAGSSVATT